MRNNSLSSLGFDCLCKNGGWCSCETSDRCFLGEKQATSYCLSLRQVSSQISFFFLSFFFYFLNWSIPKEGAILLWKEGCCVVGCCKWHLLTPTNNGGLGVVAQQHRCCMGGSLMSNLVLSRTSSSHTSGV